MSLKKILKIFKRKTGQAVLEYFVLFGLIGALTIFAINHSFLVLARNASDGLYNKANDRILDNDCRGVGVNGITGRCL